MTPNERKDYIANCLLKRGVNKNSIIAILCNGWWESGRTFSPTKHEVGGAGYGIWQFTAQPDQAIIINYAETHSEKEAIEWQTNRLLSDNPKQWYPARGYTMSWQDFLHNTQNRDWKYLTEAFCWCWERPSAYYAHVADRIGAYNSIMPINWDGNAPDGGDGNDQPKDNEQKKGTKFNDCRSLLNKNKHNNTDNQGDASQGGQGGVSQGFNNQPCLQFFNQYKGRLHYSLSGLRVQVRQGTYGDCSSFVSHMLELGYNVHNSLPNTEGLHAYLQGLGYKCIYEGANTGHIPANCQPAKTGDVIIQGRKGSSAGANGHTGICLDAPKFHDCDYYFDGLHEYDSEDAFLSWNTHGTYYYLYRKD